MEGRRRLSRGSAEVQTSQWQPMVGTPTLVPEPSTVIASGAAFSFLGRGFGFLVGGLDEAEAEFGERVFEQALLFEGEVALGLFDEDGEGIDVMARDGKVALGLLFAFVDGHESEEHLGLGAERNDQKSKRRRGEWEGRLGFGDFGFAHADILTRGIE